MTQFLCDRCRLIERVLLFGILILSAGCRLGSGADEVVQPRAPEAEILEISDGAILYPGDAPWRFSGTVTDPDGTDPGDLQVTFSLWQGAEEVTVSHPAATAAGAVSLKVNYLEEADYMLRLEVEDPTGDVGSHAISFSVKNRAPQVIIIGPVQGAEIDQWAPLVLQALIKDEDNPTDVGFEAKLITDIEGEVAAVVTDPTGTLNFEYVPKVPGPIVFTLMATDEFEAQGIAAVSVVVRECVDNDGDLFWTCPYEGAEIDCNDEDPSIMPGGQELCDGKDSDCDGETPSDEFDTDGDGMAPCAGDCDDTDPEVFLAAVELCDQKDNDCDGALPSWDQDADLDGFRGCSLDGKNIDCDDARGTIYPGALEVCDGFDTDCNGEVPPDEQDVDADLLMACEGDCDDDNPFTFPGARERLDFQDNDCDGLSEGVLGLDSAYRIWEGAQSDAYLGYSLSASGDLNADGLDDLAIGAPRFEAAGGGGTLRGGVFLVFGGADGWTDSQPRSLAEAIAVTSSEPSALLGTSVVIADVDENQVDDLIVGAPGHTTGNLIEAGAVYLVPGTTSWSTGDVTDRALTIIEGIGSDMNLGQSLAGPGDANVDGIMDIAIGAPWPTRWPSSPGLVAILNARTVAWGSRTPLTSLPRINGIDSNAIGNSIAYGEANGDGASDLLIGGMLNTDTLPGMVWWMPGSPVLRSGSASDLPSLGATHYDGITSKERVGFSVASGVDVDGDGYDDALFGRYTDGSDGAAAAYLMFGGDDFVASGGVEEVAEVRFLPSSGDTCPCTVTGIGDWNGDGLGDFAIGVARASDAANDAGKVYLFLGRSYRSSWSQEIPLANADGVLLGEIRGDYAGYAMTGGDLNGDGLDDLIVSAPFASANSGSLDSAGRIYVILGASF